MYSEKVQIAANDVQKVRLTAHREDRSEAEMYVGSDRERITVRAAVLHAIQGEYDFCIPAVVMRKQDVMPEHQLGMFEFRSTTDRRSRRK